jgi:hypothetical protein
MDDIVSSAFSISNLGMHNVNRFDLITDATWCAATAVGAAEPDVLMAAGRQTHTGA